MTSWSEANTDCEESMIIAGTCRVWQWKEKERERERDRENEYWTSKCF